MVADKTVRQGSPQAEDKAKQLYLAGGWTYAALAKKFKVSERTIIRWSKAGNWSAQRDAESVAAQAIATELSEELAKPISPKSVRATGLDRNTMLDSAMASLHANAPDAEVKSQEAAYATLVKIMQARQQMEQQERLAELELELKRAELRLKERQLNPPTVREWAQYARDKFKLSARQLIEAVKEEVENSNL